MSTESRVLYCNLIQQIRLQWGACLHRKIPKTIVTDTFADIRREASEAHEKWDYPSVSQGSHLEKRRSFDEIY